MGPLFFGVDQTWCKSMVILRGFSTFFLKCMKFGLVREWPLSFGRCFCLFFPSKNFKLDESKTNFLCFFEDKTEACEWDNTKMRLHQTPFFQFSVLEIRDMEWYVSSLSQDCVLKPYCCCGCGGGCGCCLVDSSVVWWSFDSAWSPARGQRHQCLLASWR